MAYKNWSDWMAKQEAEWEESCRLRREAKENKRREAVDEIKQKLLGILAARNDITMSPSAYEALAEWIQARDESNYERGYAAGEESATSEYD